MTLQVLKRNIRTMRYKQQLRVVQVYRKYQGKKEKHSSKREVLINNKTQKKSS
ncbi:unnamed protein product [Paramecium octaurelia]|uniref:Uncharacterized protein n=1 Tax=Paramecium octaurelia TaxID=43137 RepID=A0A8S1YLD6_PAROT|nr:unnamed protein product [Paramecium octaurelia]